MVHLPVTDSDRVQIGQVLVNLIRNALDAMHSVPIADRRLSISVSQNEQRLISISVEDAGCGAPSDMLSHMFDAFYTTKPGGLGIGLALCRTIIEDHGGQLTAENTTTGGMAFIFTLRRAT